MRRNLVLLAVAAALAAAAVLWSMRDRAPSAKSAAPSASAGPAATLRLEGTVSWPDGTPAHDAKVALIRRPRRIAAACLDGDRAGCGELLRDLSRRIHRGEAPLESLASSFSDERGAFRIDAPGGEGLWLVADAGGVFAAAPVQGFGGQLRLPEPLAIAGRVRSSGPFRLQGAWVLALSDEPPAAALVPVSPAGFFQLAWPSGARGILVAGAPGTAATWAPPADGADLRLEPFQVRGVVTQDGKPLVGAELTLRAATPASAAATLEETFAVSLGEGRFAIDATGCGWCRLTAVKDSLQGSVVLSPEQVERGVEVAVEVGKPVRLTVRTEPSAADAKVRVMEPTLELRVAGLALSALSASALAGDAPPAEPVPVGEEAQPRGGGRFVIEVAPPGDYLACAQATSFVPRCAAVRVEPGREAQLDLPLTKAGTLSGSVLLPGGKPAARARVTLLPKETGSGSPRTPEEALAVARGWALALRGVEEVPGFEVRSDEQGRFSVTGAAPGEWRARAEADGLLPVEADLATGSSATVNLVESGTLEVRAVDGEGSQAAFRRVRVEARAWPDDPGGRRDPTMHGESLLGGPIALGPLRPGAWIVEVRAPGFAPARARAQVLPGKTDLELRLDPGLTIEGRVLDESGRPLPRAEVEVWDLADSSMRQKIEVDRDGAFVVRGLSPGRHAVKATASGRSPDLAVGLLAGKGPVELRLERRIGEAPAESMLE